MEAANESTEAGFARSTLGVIHKPRRLLWTIHLGVRQAKSLLHQQQEGDFQRRDGVVAGRCALSNDSRLEYSSHRRTGGWGDSDGLRRGHALS